MTRIMQQTRTTEVQEKDALAVAVNEDDMCHYPVLNEVDKSQLKLKTGFVLKKLINDAVCKMNDDVLYATRTK